ncbi:PGA17 Predicted GPI-anchored protein 17 [Candida maltosa Xu316]
MRLSTIVATAFSVFTVVSAQPQILTPASDPLALELTERNLDGLYEMKERDLLSLAESLLEDFNISSILSSIDFESIAGWTNNLLTEDDNVKYLDYLLNFLGDTHLVPFAISYIVSNNYTRSIAGEVVVDLLGIAGRFDLTPVFVALKNSGLAYTLVADLIENPNTFPFVKSVVSDLLSDSSFNLGDLYGGTAASGSVPALSYAAVTTSAAAAAGTNQPLVAASITGLGSGSPISLGFPTTSSIPIGSIDTASLAQLFSEARTDGGSTNAAATAAATPAATVRFTSAAGGVVSATVQATVTAAAGTLPTGPNGEINYSGITGPAFQSLPPTQFGANPTSINYSALSQLAGGLGAKREYVDPVASVLNEIKKREEPADAVASVLGELRKRQEENDQLEAAFRQMKRDNIEDLLTTIFSSVARSDLLNETITYLVTDQQFEDSVFENIGSTLTGVLSVDWAALQPLVSSLLNSGLLTDIISRAFQDKDLQAALWNDITSIFKRDLALRDELLNGANGTLSSLAVSDFIASVAPEATDSLDGFQGTLSSLLVSDFINTLSVSTAASNASTSIAPVITTQAENSGFSLSTSLFSTVVAVFGLFAMMI